MSTTLSLIPSNNYIFVTLFPGFPIAGVVIRIDTDEVTRVNNEVTHVDTDEIARVVTADTIL
jgi:alpha/beta superfamily hydrolase